MSHNAMSRFRELAWVRDTPSDELRELHQVMRHLYDPAREAVRAAILDELRIRARLPGQDEISTGETRQANAL